MAAKRPKDPRERILRAAVSLFAQKGFSAVGVREIARAAGVNSAMISYYFEGKTGILKDILQEFFARYARVFESVDYSRMSDEECARALIRGLVRFVRDNTDMALVCYNELPLDVPEIAETKAEKMAAMISRIRGLLKKMGLDPENAFLLSVVGLSLISSIFAQFRSRPVLTRLFGFRFDDDYFDRYAEAIATLFLKGVGELSRRGGPRSQR